MNSHFDVLAQADKQSASAEAGEYLNQALLENKKLGVLMLSSGSALSVLDYVGPNALGENLTVSVLDERFSQDSGINNFSQLQKTGFYQLAFDAEASFFGTLPRSGEAMEDLAKRWEKNLRQWREENPTGLIFATLGMGADGHTAGIFPFNDKKIFDELFKADNWVTAYAAGNKHQFRDRVTTTFTFLKMVDLGFAFVSGAEKKGKLDEVIANKGQVNQLPALVWHEIKDVKIFTDLHC